MEKIHFYNTNTIYEGVTDFINKNVLVITFNDNTPSQDEVVNGFEILNENNDFVQAEYKEYTTIYRIYEDNKKRIELSNDESVYVEPEPIPEPEPYVPSLDEIRTQKINELSSLCNMNIVNGVTFSVGGEAESFSYDHNDQTNIREAFDIALITKTPMYYHSNNNAKKLYSVEQIIELYYRQFINKMHHTIYYNQLKMYINTLGDRESIENVEYGQELTGGYLASYNSAMEQSKTGIKALLENYSYGHVVGNLEMAT